jgi:hypothetical protein
LVFFQASLQKSQKFLNRGESGGLAAVNLFDPARQLTLDRIRFRIEPKYKSAFHIDRTLLQTPDALVEFRCFCGGILKTSGEEEAGAQFPGHGIGYLVQRGLFHRAAPLRFA